MDYKERQTYPKRETIGPYQNLDQFVGAIKNQLVESAQSGMSPYFSRPQPEEYQHAPQDSYQHIKPDQVLPGLDEPGAIEQYVAKVHWKKNAKTVQANFGFGLFHVGPETGTPEAPLPQDLSETMDKTTAVEALALTKAKLERVMDTLSDVYPTPPENIQNYMDDINIISRQLLTVQRNSFSINDLTHLLSPLRVNGGEVDHKKAGLTLALLGAVILSACASGGEANIPATTIDTGATQPAATEQANPQDTQVLPTTEPTATAQATQAPTETAVPTEVPATPTETAVPTPEPVTLPEDFHIVEKFTNPDQFNSLPVLTPEQARSKTFDEFIADADNKGELGKYSPSAVPIKDMRYAWSVIPYSQVTGGDLFGIPSDERDAKIYKDFSKRPFYDTCFFHVDINGEPYIGWVQKILQSDGSTAYIKYVYSYKHLLYVQSRGILNAEMGALGFINDHPSSALVPYLPGSGTDWYAQSWGIDDTYQTKVWPEYKDKMMAVHDKLIDERPSTLKTEYFGDPEDDTEGNYLWMAGGTWTFY